MPSRTRRLLAVLLAGALSAAAQRAEPPLVPPLSMTCPMHPDVVESRPGTCPICRMALTPVRLDTAWMCPVHSTVTGEEEGVCRICGRALVRAQVAVTWTCLVQPGIERLEPGICPDGSAMARRQTLRPHGNHNPQHGGQFFMAPDNWHHLEGTYPFHSVFRLHVYDDYARPLAAADLRRIDGRIVTRETFDPRTRQTTELAAFPLQASADGMFLEARIEAVRLPAEMTAKLRIKPGSPEYRFDFTFHELTTEPVPASRPGGAAPAAAPPTRAVAVPPDTTARDAAAAAAADPLAPAPIPETVAGMLEQLQLRDRHVGGLIADGNFGAVWVPAFHAKDLAVALEPHLGHLSQRARETAEPALQQIVRLAWLLDAYGDVGNRQQLDGAYAPFSAAIADVVAAFAEAR